MALIEYKNRSGQSQWVESGSATERDILAQPWMGWSQGGSPAPAPQAPTPPPAPTPPTVSSPSLGKILAPPSAPPAAPAPLKDLPAGSAAGAYRYDSKAGGWVPTAPQPNADAPAQDQNSPGGQGKTEGKAEGAGPDMTGWTDAMIQSFEARQTYIQTLLDQGKMVNPNIVIDETTIKRFEEQSKAELKPYYGQVFAQSDADIQKGFNDIAGDYGRRELGLSQEYGKNLEATQENFAKRGLEFSSDRDRAEKELADNANKQLEDAQRTAQDQAHQLGTQGERSIGSALMPRAPSIRTGTTAGTGKPGEYSFSFGTGSRSLFNPVGGTTGTTQRTQLFDEKSRVAELTENERKLRASQYL